MSKNVKYPMSNIQCPMKFHVIVLFGIGIYLTLVLLVIPKSAWAASPSPAPSSSPDAKAQFQQKVEDIKNEAATRSAEYKSQVSQTIQNKAFSGTIIQVGDKQFTLQSKTVVHTIKFNQYTVFLDTAKRTATVGDLKKDDYIIALGDIDDNQVLKAKKIIRTKAPVVEEKTAIWGQVQSILVSTLNILKNDNQKVAVNINSSTTYKFGPSDITLADIKPTNFIISIGSKINNNTSTAKFIYLLNPNGDLNIKNASSSATPSATPKSSPASTKKP